MLAVAFGVDAPLPVSANGIVECEAGREDEGDRFVQSIVGPVELAVEDEHSETL